MLATQSFSPPASAHSIHSTSRSPAFGSNISLSSSRILPIDHVAPSSGFLSARAASPPGRLARPAQATSPPHQAAASPLLLARPARSPSPMHQGIGLSASSKQHLSSQQCPGAGPSSGLMSASGICRSPLLLHRVVASAPSRGSAAGIRAPDIGTLRWRDAGDSLLKAAPHHGSQAVQWAADAMQGSHADVDVNQMTQTAPHQGQACRPTWRDPHVNLAEPVVDGNPQQPSRGSSWPSSMAAGTAAASSSSRSETPQHHRRAYCAGSGGGGTSPAHTLSSSSLVLRGNSGASFVAGEVREARTISATAPHQGKELDRNRVQAFAEGSSELERQRAQPHVLPARPLGEAQVQAQCPGPDQDRLVTQQTQAKLQELARQKEELERKLNEDSQCFVQSLLDLEKEVQSLREKNRLLEEKSLTGAKDEELRAAAEEERKAKEVQMQELLARNAKLESDCQDSMRQFEAFARERNEEASRVREEAALLQTKLLEQEQAFQRRLQEVERDRENLLQLMSDESKELQNRVDKLTEDKEAMSLDLARALARADLGDATASAAEGSPRESRDKERADALRRSQSECEVLKDEVAIKEGQLVLLRNQLEIAERKLRLSDMENTMLKTELEASRRNVESCKHALTAPLEAS
eukprot:TRINITY_DN75535_c0_g1_i1.p1 TRINITY_DN75535_c0_g1~~TRINITY_DN75535_c0_g1_i1.p1  ORF type:complete len:640 (-),score=141.85 TRINITY_DN75535_c0_g1_i1:52-1971(-)